jgi:hypothetical protein
MISNRHAPNATENAQLVDTAATMREGNRAWLARAGMTEGILLLGGTSLSHFRLRVAQSHLRQDMQPSFWSFAGLYQDGKVQSVRLEFDGDASDMPVVNGVQVNDIAEFNDPHWYPNIAVVSLGVDPQRLAANVERVKAQRSIIDLPQHILPWLGYVWGAGQRGNPLLEGIGLPSAAFVETVYALADVELTPGLSSSATCPEAIWQTAKWWRHYFEGLRTIEGAQAVVPTGKFATRQRAAAVHEPTQKARARA